MKAIIVVMVIAVFLVVGGMIIVQNGFSGNPASGANANNVSIADGQQIIEISARGGYAPKISAARAGIPTVIKMKTAGTFDCSSAVVIPSIGYRANLPASGETLIDIPAQQPGAKLQGLCAMGMYNFAIDFN